MFGEGRSPDQIAQIRGLVRSTVENHLFEALQAGEKIDLDRLVSPEQYRAIDQALDKLGTDQLKPVLEHLGPEYTYGQLRLVRWARRRPAPDT